MNWLAIWMAMTTACESIRSEGKWDYPYPVPIVIKLAISPALTPKQQDQFLLSSERNQTRPGNRVLAYLEAALILPDSLGSKDRQFEESNRRGEWSTSRPDQLLADAMERDLRSSQKALKQFVIASHFQRCEWQETRPRSLDSDPQETWVTSKLRLVVNLAALNIKLDLLRNRNDNAFQTIQAIFQIGQDYSKKSAGYNFLAANAMIANVGVYSLVDWISRPDTPNVYHSLASRKRPFLDPTTGFDGDREVILHEHELLKKATKDSRSDEDIERYVQQFRKRAGYDVLNMDFLLKIENPKAVWEELLTWRCDELVARKDLVDRGFTRKQIDAMNPGYVVFESAWLRTIAKFEVVVSCFRRPMPEQIKRLHELEKKENELKEKPSMDRTYRQLLPYTGPIYSKVSMAIVIRERQFDMLQTIEAIRLHAAETGQWPDKLTDIKLVPVPNDPATGKPFEFKRIGNKIELYAPPPIAGEQPNRGNAIRYDLTLRPIEKR